MTDSPACFRDYDQSRRAYLQALKLSTDSENILRDLSQLQIHLRDYEGYEQSRRKLVVAKPGLISNWVAFAGAAYVNRNYRGALDCVTSILRFDEEGSMKNTFNA